MPLLILLAISTLLSISISTAPPQSPLNPASHSHGPHKEYAIQNAPQIFNALHSSMRQWGSSLNHNGMSFFAASVPANTLLYHGTVSPVAPQGMEWLAFEIEHAEVFARPRRPPPTHDPDDPDAPHHPPPPAPRNSPNVDDGNSENSDGHGYLQIYRTRHELSRLLYIDGMSAGKSSLGTLDTQDLILRNVSSDSRPWNDYGRAQDLCSLGDEWRIEGFVRMEAGFELILCNFTEGVEMVSAMRRPESGDGEVAHWEYMRAVAKRYGGITGGRVEIDYSSMVSAFFYPINLTNPDESKASLPRLSRDYNGLERIKTDLRNVLSSGKSEGRRSVDWQGVVDMIVTRYSDRLKFMVYNATTARAFLSDISVLLNVYINYEEVDIPASISRCSNHYLTPITPQTPQDHLIYKAVSTVTHQICKTLFKTRDILLSDKANIEDAKSAVKELIGYLNWTTWLECGNCGYDEVCFVAIWPWGAPGDHERPGCIKPDQMQGRRGYWEFS